MVGLFGFFFLNFSELPSGAGGRLLYFVVSIRLIMEFSASKRLYADKNERIAVRLVAPPLTDAAQGAYKLRPYTIDKSTPYSYT